jgi:uracil phosphoribosyltransferase
MLTDLSADPFVRLLVDATRRAEASGPALAFAHRAVGHALASHVARGLRLEEAEIDHVAGPSTGVRIVPGAEPVVIALLRAGLFIAEGVWERLPGASLLLHGHDDVNRFPLDGRTVVVVDSVINTGRTMREVLKEVDQRSAAATIVATLVAYRPNMVRLAEEHPQVNFVAARISDRTYVGRGKTDTGARLFGTTLLE